MFGCPSVEPTEYGAYPHADAVPDWVVGELRATRREGLGARGLIYGNNLRPSIQPGTIDSPCTGDSSIHGNLATSLAWYCGDPDTQELTSGNYEPTTEDKLRAWAASKYFALPSYSLAALDIVGDSGAGWAVGEHGALLRLEGGKLDDAPEPSPPALGSRRAERAPDASPYAGAPARPGAPAGAVPEYAGREPRELSEPELVPWGSPNPAAIHREGQGTDQQPREVVMSRDGSEGWAVGTDRPEQRTTLMHFDGESWSHCEMSGIPGQIARDPACAALHELPAFKLSDRDQPVQLQSLARVPYENDPDPTNDDEFEVWAIGSAFVNPAEKGEYEPKQNGQIERAALVRYREGHWEQVPFAERAAVEGPFDAAYGMRPLISFAAPDEGWIVGKLHAQALYHYNGEDWVDCEAAEARAECGLEGGDYTRLPDGELAAVDGRTFAYGTRRVADESGNRPTFYPWILSREPGEPWSAAATDAGLDPGREAEPSQAIQGDVRGLALLPDAGEQGLWGWAIGNFQTEAVGQTKLLRLTDAGWEPYDDSGVIETTFERPGSGPRAFAGYNVDRGVALSGSGGLVRNTGSAALGRAQGYIDPDRSAVAAFRDSAGRPVAAFASTRNPPHYSVNHNLFAFDPERERWRRVNGAVPRSTPTSTPSSSLGLQTVAPDGRGGAWVSIRDPRSGDSPPYFFRYTDRAPEPVFAEAPSPQASVAPAFTGLAGTAQGTMWLATASDTLYRYSRGVGWDRVRVPGWDPGKVVTRASEANAIALNDAGVGVVVGKGGRIAAIEGDRVRLDPAAGGRACSLNPAPPCGTGYSLRSASVAPDGSAILGGDRLAMLWRPAGGEFRAIARPQAASSATIVAVSMPTPTLAWLATDTGLIFRGERTGETWAWSRVPENLNALEEPLTLDERGQTIPIRAMALDAQGRGYAVGDRGLLLYRPGDGGGERAWVRLHPHFRDDLTAVSLASGGSESALIGGRSGAILTATGARVSVARPGDFASTAHHIGELTGAVVGLALVPGPHEGQSEAWAALAGAGGMGATAAAPATGAPNRGANQLLHYASHPDEPLLAPQGLAASLPDARAPRAGEISFAALGNTRCVPIHSEYACPALNDSTSFDEQITRRSVEEIAARGDEPGGPAFALFTGDALDSPGQAHEPESGVISFSEWLEQIVRPLEEGGVPLYAALGARDLSRPAPGESEAWRTAMAERPAPWGEGEPAEIDGLEVEPIESDLGLRLDDVEAEDPSDPGGPGLHVALSGARTHYAFDLVDPETDEQRLRVIFADTSSRSLAGSAGQQPIELTGQQAWLSQMLCREGEESTYGECTRGKTQPAIVVSTTPTYSYGPGGQETETDAAVLESLLLEGEASLVLSGRLGWNALYWTCAAGIHYPEPGGSYPDTPPKPGESRCSQAAAAADPAAQLDQSAAGLQGAASQTGLLPNVIASSAGSVLGQGSGGASNGFWHGYTIVRMAPDGDPYETIVEQRPILDWVEIQGTTHALAPRRRLRLRGFGREPVAHPPANTFFDVTPQVERYDPIDSAAITHRYDLVLADPEEPWLACEAAEVGCQELQAGLSRAGGAEGASESSAELAAQSTSEANPCDPYLCLPERIATIDRTTGEVRAGDGRYPETFAVAMLSVGEKVATYPLLLERSPSFVVRSAIRTPAAPKTSNPSTPRPPGQPPIPEPPTIPEIKVPAIPAPPAIPPLTAAAPPEPQPPAPPAPPPPTQQPAALDLTVAPPGVSISTPTALIQPPTPPVNPAPPGGARREARQRQAAAQKGGADSEASETQENGGDMAQGPPSSNSAASTRLDATRGTRAKPAPSFTALAAQDQPSAWTQGALYGGGLTLGALILAFSWATLRPTPRRRGPEVPAPAWARQARRRPR
jgi:hypothetical protein